MAGVRHHHHPRRTPRWAAKSMTAARSMERTCERHWPFAAYVLLTLATAGYVVGQIATLV